MATQPHTYVLWNAINFGGATERGPLTHVDAPPKI
jgi:hypothetical protein